MSKYIKVGAKEEQKRRMKEQLSTVQHKITKWADKKVVVGYEAPTIERKEGDVWEENDKTWTIKNGIKQTVDKLTWAKTPWWCPKCGRVLNHKLHEKFYRIRGACHDCVVVWEGKMRMDGVWDVYERKTMRDNEKSFLKDKIQQHESWMNSFTEPQLHFADGRWETLAQKELFTKAFDELKADIKFLNDRYEVIIQEEEKDKLEYEKLSRWLVENPWTVSPKS